jgi:hypothetical protein
MSVNKEICFFLAKFKQKKKIVNTTNIIRLFRFPKIKNLNPFHPEKKREKKETKKRTSLKFFFEKPREYKKVITKTINLEKPSGCPCQKNLL